MAVGLGLIIPIIPSIFSFYRSLETLTTQTPTCEVFPHLRHCQVYVSSWQSFSELSMQCANKHITDKWVIHRPTPASRVGQYNVKSFKCMGKMLNTAEDEWATFTVPLKPPLPFRGSYLEASVIFPRHHCHKIPIGWRANQRET